MNRIIKLTIKYQSDENNRLGSDNREWEIDELIRRNHSYLYPVEVEEVDETEIKD